MSTKESGQTLVEVIVAAAVGTLVVSALTFTAVFSIRNASFSKASVQATKLGQEGIERVRIGRDRNSTISGGGLPVNSWNGSQPIWAYQISKPADCGDPSIGLCYFNVGSFGTLSNIGVQAASFPSSQAEKLTSASQEFQRAVILSDDGLDYTIAKKVTVIVRWKDASGMHESKLVTILRKK